MIRIIYDPDKLFMDISGHAGYGERGKDIVCAGVSALVFTLAAAVDGYEEHRGGIYIKCPNASKKPIFDAIVNGLKMIEKDYPENLLITMGRSGLKYRPGHAGETAERKKYEYVQI